MSSLRIEIRESIKLGESNYNSYNAQTIKNVNDVSKRLLTEPVTESVILSLVEGIQ